MQIGALHTHLFTNKYPKTVCREFSSMQTFDFSISNRKFQAFFVFFLSKWARKTIISPALENQIRKTLKTEFSDESL